MRLAETSDPPRRKGEPTIALINIVFLMLIFFLVTAQIAPPLDRNLDLVSTQDLEGREPPDALVITADGEMAYRGALVTPAQYVTIRQESEPNLESIRLVPDKALSAMRLIDVGDALRSLGIEKVFIVTERGLSSP